MSNKEIDKTIRDSENRTLHEETEGRRIQEKPIIKKPSSKEFSLKQIRGYSIQYQYPAMGAEADICQVSKNDRTYILKLYREGITPKDEILKKIQTISNQHPEHFIRLFEFGFDTSSHRWYEIQEYAKFDTLNELIRGKRITQRIYSHIIKEIFYSITLLHQNQILHLDLKPTNILIRTLEPLDLILTDFGVATILSEEFSRKLTEIKGTPLYWAPEQLSGIVGKETDYWAMGMIILEILNGKHPFSGLDNKVIMYTLSTKGIEISSSLPEEYSLLIKGLLTKDPKKRWGEKEVTRWLKGERNIPVYYEVFSDIDSVGKKKFYSFRGADYYSLEDLVESFIEGEDNWNEAKMHLGRGYILKWLEDVRDFDHAIFFEKNTDTNLDTKLFNLIYSANKTLPFALFGKLIDESNLYLYAGKILRKEGSDGENKIIQAIRFKDMLNYSNKYIEWTQNHQEIHEIVNLLSGKHASQMFILLDIFKHPEKYHIPDGIDLTDKIATLTLFTNAVSTRDDVPLFRSEEYNQIASSYIIPLDIDNRLRSKNDFASAYDKLKKLQNQGLLIKKDVN